MPTITLLDALWTTTCRMAPWLLMGFIFAGILKRFVSPQWVTRHLGRASGRWAILKAVLLGVPLPLCSCGVLPLAAGLKDSGASKGATSAFLISTPQTGLDSFFATYALMGWVFAIARPLIALMTGVVGGICVDQFDRDDATPTPPPTSPKKSCCHAEAPQPAPKSCCCSKKPEPSPEPKSCCAHHDTPHPPAQASCCADTHARPPAHNPIVAILTDSYTLFRSVSRALAVGLLLSALIFYLVPDNALSNYQFLASDWVMMPLMLLIGMPLYVCSTGSIPVVVALIAKGLSPGAGLVFLMVGPAMNAASLTVLGQLLGKRSLAIYLSVLSIGALLAGIALNLLHAHAAIVLPNQLMACHPESLTLLSQIAGATLIVLLISAIFWRPRH